MRSRVARVVRPKVNSQVDRIGSFVIEKGIRVVDKKTGAEVASVETDDGICSVFVVNQSWRLPRFLIVALPSVGKRKLKEFLEELDV